MRTAILSTFLVFSVAAQTPGQLAFDVASVRINHEFDQGNKGTWRSTIQSKPGSLTMRNVSMTMIAAWAYHVQRPQVTGPSGLDDQRYDIVAKADRPAEDDDMRKMLQALLAERFHFTSHRDTRQMEALVLSKPKSGESKMRASQVDGPPEISQDAERGAIIKGIGLGTLLDELSKEMELPLVDQTGLTGKFDISINLQKYVNELKASFTPGTQPPPESELKITLMRDMIAGELGLRLGTRKTAVEMIVVDKVDKTPVEN